MEWLVRTESRLPADTTAERREQLRAAERARAMELRGAGVLKRLWRVPGGRGTVGLYECDDASQLHAALSSLPMFPWMEVAIEPLATHPQEAEPPQEAELGDGESAMPVRHGASARHHEH